MQMSQIMLSCIAIGIIVKIWSLIKKKKILQKTLNQSFPYLWRETLRKRIVFYIHLDESDKQLFEKRITYFLATKAIEGIEIKIDDTIRLMVASSAVIPTFAFPNYNYPYVKTILIYPNSFDEKFQTTRYNGNKEFNIGMVGSSFQNGTVILSLPDLLKDFDGHHHRDNVGIHEFVHLLDREDGDIDGIPEFLMDHKYIGLWLHEIKNEIKRIENGKSDINPYALTNNAEFLAVVSEYFFNNPRKFERRHPELYQFLSTIFNKNKNFNFSTPKSK